MFECRSESPVDPIGQALHYPDKILEDGKRTSANFATVEDLCYPSEVAITAQWPSIARHFCEYNSAIFELHNVFRCLTTKEPASFQGVLGWIAFVYSSFASVLQQRHPTALVVLAYYGFALHALRHAWWLHQVGLNLVQSIDAILEQTHEQEWRHLLWWSLHEVHLSSSSQIQAVITETLLLTEGIAKSTSFNAFEGRLHLYIHKLRLMRMDHDGR